MHHHLIFALHGFLGRAEDWQACEKFVPGIWIKPELFPPASMPIASYEIYVSGIIEKYLTNLILFKRKVFVGYSLGGRLGLHILEKYAAMFDHFVFVSTHPGLTSEKEMALRLEKDRQWARLLANEKWQAFMAQWNSQEVFSKALNRASNITIEPTRDETDFDKTALELALVEWSLGAQKNFENIIQRHQNKISWVVGSEDEKFLKIAEDLKQKKILLDYNKIFSGHRILTDNPQALGTLLQKLF